MIHKTQPPRQGSGTDNGHHLLCRMMRSLIQTSGNGTSPSQAFSMTKNNNNGKTSSFAQTSNKVFGRDEELEQLIHVFSTIVSRNNQTKHKTNGTKLALVHGVSGVGKSTLVQAFVNQLSKQQTTFFASGKFDQLKTHLPYAAFMQAANDLARQLIQREDSDDIINRIQAALGPELPLLCSIIEPLSQIFVFQANQGSRTLLNESDNNSHSKNNNTKVTTCGQAFARFKLLMRTFLCSIASADTPIIIFLDDLQWADSDSLEVLQSLITDTMSQFIMIIGAYRDNEMTAENLQKIVLTNQHPSIEFADIALANLQLSALNQMISSLLNVDAHQQETRELANVILSKTLGNPFYVLNFMDQLCLDGLLTKEEDGTTWLWDVDAISHQSDVADNLAQILKDKVMRMPEQVRSILQLASFIGHDFSADILTTIVHAEQDMIEEQYSFDLIPREIIERRITSALQVALEEGLLEGDLQNAEAFKFSHDCIQQCLYQDLIPDIVEQQLLHQRIGRLIWEKIKKAQSDDDDDNVEDWMIFLAADNLNRSPKDNVDGLNCIEAVELNRRAANLAAEKAAFLVAAEYFRSATKLASCQDLFSHDSKMWFELHDRAAEVEISVGNYDESARLAHKVHERAQTMENECPAFFIEIKAHAAQGRLMDAMNLSFRVLRQLGVKFPKKITQLTIVAEYMRTKLLIGRRHPTDLANLPILYEKKIFYALKLLSTLSIHSFLAGDAGKNTYVAVQLRMTYLTVRFGLSEEFSPQAFAAYGSVCCFLGEFNVGFDYNKLALGLQRRFGNESSLGQLRWLCLSFVEPWTRGIDLSTHERFKENYHNAMLNGDVDNAHWNIYGWFLTGFYVGVPLDSLVKKTRHYCLEMKELGSRNHLLVSLPLLQMFLNFCGDEEGKNDDPGTLCGSALCLDSFELEVKETKSLTILTALRISELIVALHFGENWERIRAIYPEILKKLLKTADGIWVSPCCYAYMIWASFQLFEKSGRAKKYKKHARRLGRTLENWGSKGSPISRSLSKLVQAGKAKYFASKKSGIELNVLEPLFQAAIEELGGMNFFVFQTLALGALADSFISCGKVQRGAECLKNAIEVYRRWGAEEKARLLSNEPTKEQQECKP